MWVFLDRLNDAAAVKLVDHNEAKLSSVAVAILISVSTSATKDDDV
jgi:hypothetical protein